MARLQGKKIVITGGTGILGSAYCRAAVQEGASVVVSDLDAAMCEALAREISPDLSKAKPLAVDLSREESILTWAREILKDGTPDVVVNNAASKPPGFFRPLAEYSLETWNAAVSVNMTAVFLVARELGTPMAKRGRGNMINVSSIYGVVAPDPRIYEGSNYPELGGAINTPLVYSATKGAVISMTRYMAAYWGPQGVRVNTLTPGGVESGQNNTFVERYRARVPMDRMATVADLAGAFVYLASDESGYVNGHNLVVDGGWTAW